ncbi:unnamed protein product [Rotaria sp. Silwood2]|nr:unnamed protein product [Rotaria sp. Silwood2]CAF3967857.1 unnamed protein product [Rotaria sp. Silwood2]
MDYQVNDEESSINNHKMIDNGTDCCLWNILGKCTVNYQPSEYFFSISEYTMILYYLEYSKWPQSSVLLADLTDDMTEYLRHLNVISYHHDVIVPISERDLILNRLYRYAVVDNVDFKICPLHRYTMGVGWRIHDRCQFADHNVGFKQSRLVKRRRSASTSSTPLRVAPLHLAEKIVGFPYGGKICNKHRKQVEKEDAMSVDDFNVNYTNEDDNDVDMETNSTVQSFVMFDESNEQQTQRILAELDQSPIKSRCRAPLVKQTPGAVRRMTGKLRKVVAAATTILANSISPGQANTLIHLAGLDNVLGKRASSTQNTAAVIDKNFLAYLVEMYKAYEEKNLPYDEKIRILALIPESWNLSYEDIMDHFQCTEHAIKAARALKRASSTPLHVDQKPSIIRRRYDSAQIDHFLTWLIETKLLVSVHWGNTHLKLENGNTLTIPRQVLQAKRSHAIHQYKSHCSVVDFKPLGDRKLLYILEGINTRSQKAISGMDDFAKAAADGWEALTNLLPNLRIEKEEKQNLLNCIENSSLYLKSSYSTHCNNNSECATHCTVFALSQATNPEFFEMCKHKHDTYCKECLAVFQLFDDLEQLIEKEQDEEKREEFKYDFGLARESIFEMFRHRIRTVQQDSVKSRVLASMSNTTAFETIDWAQKILPQGFREGQTAYFGKKGMSALVGSFTFYDASSTLTTRTYILCLTQCDQTEQATLSGGYLILKQFCSEYPHITSIIKRSDNASILAGQATPEGEWFLSKLANVTLLMRDYSEVQSGRAICDRIIGAAKMRMKACLHAGHDVTNASQIKRAMEYCGGVKNVIVATAEILENIPPISKTRIADISTIRNIVYQGKHMILRKASEIGPGRAVSLSLLDVPVNMQIIESFEVMRSDTIPISTATNTTTTSSSFIHLPKRFSLFNQTGWALRVHKPSQRIDKSVKDYIQKVYDDEKINGRKVPAEEYVRSIRAARNPDGTKMFSPSQYLTASQVRTQIRQLVKVKDSSNRFNAMSIDSNVDSQLNGVSTLPVYSVIILPDFMTTDTHMIILIFSLLQQVLHIWRMLHKEHR